ncbi:MAG TPA: ABC transporter permease [Oxalobacteraceae bacterium]|nr:ABC transporter permease [Oxalobacteraceae bacterium]
MISNRSFLGSVRRMGSATARWLAAWWRVLYFGALVLSLALSPATYSRNNRRAIARQIVLGTMPNLAWFTVLSALISLVLIRIVVVTALSYGLSQYALEMVVRVLVLELVPLIAALFVALRCTMPDGAELVEMRARGDFDALQRQGIDPLCLEFLPRIMAGMFSVVMLVAVSCVTSLVLAYLTIYGFTPWALAGYTHVVGQVFNPGVTMILVLKTLFFSLAVSLIPMSTAFHVDVTEPVPMPVRSRSKAANELAGMVRLFSVILLIEVASLIGNYY